MGTTASSMGAATTKISVKPAGTPRSASGRHLLVKNTGQPAQIMEENMRLREKILTLEEELTTNKLHSENASLRQSNEELTKEIKQLKGLLMVVDSPASVRSTFSVNSSQSDPSDDRLDGNRRSWPNGQPDRSTEDRPSSSSPRPCMLSESRARRLDKLRVMPMQNGHGLFPMNDIDAYGKGLAVTHSRDLGEKTLEKIRSYRTNRETAKSTDEQDQEH